MTRTHAADVLGINRAKWELKNMVRALSMCTWLNDADDNARLLAAKFALRHWTAYQAECAERRNRKYATVGQAFEAAYPLGYRSEDSEP